MLKGRQGKWQNGDLDREGRPPGETTAQNRARAPAFSRSCTDRVLA